MINNIIVLILSFLMLMMSAYSYEAFKKSLGDERYTRSQKILSVFLMVVSVAGILVSLYYFANAVGGLYKK